MAGTDRVRVMVVDDQADARFLVRVVVEEHADLEVVAEAADGTAALAALAAAAPHVAVVDARMPGIDGFELTARLLAQAPGLRVVLLTSLVDEHVRRRAVEAGAAACLSKADVHALPDLLCPG